jgi:hypothetical protein
MLESRAQAPLGVELASPGLAVGGKVRNRRRLFLERGQGAFHGQLRAAESGIDPFPGEGVEKTGGVPDEEGARSREPRAAIGKRTKTPNVPDRPDMGEAIPKTRQRPGDLGETVAQVGCGNEFPPIDDETDVGQLGCDRVQDTVAVATDEDLSDIF